MTMYFVGIDISKYKHDCCIISAASQKVVSKFTIKNNKSGFEQLYLTLNSLSTPEDIKIGFESTAHYALNLELFLENANHSLLRLSFFLSSLSSLFCKSVLFPFLLKVFFSGFYLSSHVLLFTPNCTRKSNFSKFLSNSVLPSLICHSAYRIWYVHQKRNMPPIRKFFFLPTCNLFPFLCSSHLEF